MLERQSGCYTWPMKDNNKKSDRTLESFKIFPYVAWGITLLFALFVYNIAVDLKETTTRLQAQTDALELRANTPIDQITDFENLPR